ncbi:MAG TPA: hypothetical protein VJ848_12910 [Candidatus Angelobacter sp.]|nr:hypothetical protein [Candidatus Angelobacter sp.]
MPEQHRKTPDIRIIRCPGCGGKILLLRSKIFKYGCPHCKGIVILSRLHLTVSYVLGFILSLIIAKALQLSVMAAPLWIPIFVLSFVGVAQLAALVISPYEVYRYDAQPPGAIARNLGLFLAIWLGIVVTIMTNGYVLGWLAYLIGSHRDLIESMDLWSMPLGFVNPEFVVRPDKGLVEVIGIVSANSYFWALGLMLVFKFVHSRMRRSRVTELAISGTTVGEEDDGL